MLKIHSVRVGDCRMLRLGPDRLQSIVQVNAFYRGRLTLASGNTKHSSFCGLEKWVLRGAPSAALLLRTQCHYGDSTFRLGHSQSGKRRGHTGPFSMCLSY